MKESRDILRALINEALQALAAEKSVEAPAEESIGLERPREEAHGDWATNVALKCAKSFAMNSRELAADLTERLASNRYIKSVDIAGPGFINFTLSNQWTADLIGQIFAEGSNFGRCPDGQGRRVQVEFVSANPTGPLHVGHGRGAAVGDVLCNLLAFAGWQVEKEYYVNDAGNQMNMLGASVQARYFELNGQSDKAPFPADGYKGDYIYDVARNVIAGQGDTLLNQSLEESLPFFRDFASAAILEMIRNDLNHFGVLFDEFYSEKSLYSRDLVRQASEVLKDRGFEYEQEGALWFRSTDFGDDKDRVLFRSNGEPTYFASDIAYHKDKFDRGFDRIIDVWGSDHHGYVPRMKAAVSALGYNADQFDITLIQFVNLVRDGKQISMSTRSGEFVPLQDVVNEVGVDATRYNFLMRRCDSHVDFDLELAKRESTENPVYYVQYAHARIASILRRAAEMNLPSVQAGDFAPDLVASQEEKSLLTHMAQFPDEVAKAAAGLESHRLVTYVYELASLFHVFYNSCRIIDEKGALQSHHLTVVEATGIVLSTVLGLLGISAPERM